MFTANDIQILLETFPLGAPSLEGEPILVRSFSGDRLVRSDVVHKQFKSMLEDESNTVLISSLPNTLGIEDAQWLLQEPGVILNRSANSILPRKLQQNLVENFSDATAEGFVDHARFAESHDLKAETLEQVLNQLANLTHSATIVSEGRAYHCSSAFMDKSMQTLYKAFRAADETGEIVELDTMLPGISQGIIHHLANDISRIHENDIDGRLERSEAGISYIPKSAARRTKLERQSSIQRRVELGLRCLQRDGFCDLGDLAETNGATPAALVSEAEVISALQEKRDEKFVVVTPTALTKSNGLSQSSILVKPTTLSNHHDELAHQAQEYATQLWAKRDLGQEFSFNQDIIDQLANTSLFKDLSTKILHSEHVQPIHNAFTTKLQDLQSQTHLALSTALQRTLLAPMKLYSTGTTTITDPTLHSHVTAFVFDHLRTELIPEALKIIRSDRSLIPNKATLLDLDKFSNAVHAATSLDDIQTAIKKLIRKQKVDPVDHTTLVEVKKEVLGLKVQAMGRMKRGSDLLQNLIWVVLATTATPSGTVSECMFMSSGKDTSRMIKFCGEYTGNSETGKRLEALRDVIKNGKETEGHRVEMRQWTETAVRDMGTAG